MSAFNAATELPGNGLYRIAGASGGLLGVFLLAGAFGHLAAVWSPTLGEGNLRGLRAFLLLLPGFVLVISALTNLLTCRALWAGTQWALRLALIVNVVAAIYFAYLLQRGIPNHPIGFFLAFVAIQVIVLGAIPAGLTWPATKLSRLE